jgi:hypothetical protein
MAEADLSQWPADRVERRPLDAVLPDARNPRTHTDAQVAQIAASMREWGWTMPLLVDEAGTLIAGHGRLMAARRLGWPEAPVMVARGWTEAQKRAYLIADNRLALSAGWDGELLGVELRELEGLAFNMELLGFSADELEDWMGSGAGAAGPPESGAGNLAARFMVPPFSVLNAREGWWQERKRAWLALGIRSELGRGDDMVFSDNLAGHGAALRGRYKANATPAGSLMPAMKQKGHVPGSKTVRGDGKGRPIPAGLTHGELPSYDGAHRTITGTSIFDPVLCEIAYRWFCPPQGLVLDPFAGGSVRGIVAAKLGRAYVGMDLRAAQTEANREQAEAIIGPDEPMPRWLTGDSRTIDTACADVHADMLFTCPPYADLEVYSNDPADLSTLAYPDFREAYREIIAKACARLKRDRFAAVVVGEVRGPDGAYYDFVGDTVQAFRDAGLAYYNEAILVTAVGSLPIRAGRQFAASRKLGKTHQNVLVFVKGDAKRAILACGDVEVDEALFEGLGEGDDGDDAPPTA